MKHSAYVLIALLFMVSCASAQKLCGGADPVAGVPLEIHTDGRGMLWPKGRRLFLRLYDSGRIEYDATTRAGRVRKKGRLKAREAGELRALLERPDFLDAREGYPKLIDYGDALHWTCVVARVGKRYKRILLTNYAPSDGTAGGYYPESLAKLLRRVVEVRPQTRYEREFGKR